MTGRILLLLALAAAGPARAQDAAGIIGRSSRVYRSLGSLRAEFTQVIQNPMIDSSESRGTLMQAGESKFAMRFSEPPGEAIVIDGQHVWVYTPSTVPGQVIRLSVPSGGPVYGYNMLAWLLDRPAERYKATFVKDDRLNGRPMDVIELVPAVPGSAVRPGRSLARPPGRAAAPAGDNRAERIPAHPEPVQGPGQPIASREGLRLRRALGCSSGGSVSL